MHNTTTIAQAQRVIAQSTVQPALLWQEMSPVPPLSPTLDLRVGSKQDLAWAQAVVTEHHYLRKPVDPRGSLLSYIAWLDERRVGALIFSRPQATRCADWFGSVADVASGRCRLTRWQVLSLARVWLDPVIQVGGPYAIPCAATWLIARALRRVVTEYLEHFPPCFLDEPWELAEVLSFNMPWTHRGVIYKAANFRLARTNAKGLQTYVRPLRPLTRQQRAHIEQIALAHPRSRRYRSQRRETERYRQGGLGAVDWFADRV